MIAITIRAKTFREVGTHYADLLFRLVKSASYSRVNSYRDHSDSQDFSLSLSLIPDRLRKASLLLLDDTPRNIRIQHQSRTAERKLDHLSAIANAVMVMQTYAICDT
jgi:hypothetical protein